METLRSEPAPPFTRPITHSVSRPASPRWKHALGFAAAAVVVLAFSLAGYQIGVLRGHGSTAAVASAGPTASKVQSRLNSSVGAKVPAPQSQTAPADDLVAAVRKQARLDQGEIANLNDQLNRVERELADRSADLNRSAGSAPTRKLAEVQSNALSLEARLSLIGKETSEDT
jgi:hypothetical protein